MLESQVCATISALPLFFLSYYHHAGNGALKWSESIPLRGICSEGGNVDHRLDDWSGGTCCQRAGGLVCLTIALPRVTVRFKPSPRSKQMYLTLWHQEGSEFG